MVAMDFDLGELDIGAVSSQARGLTELGTGAPIGNWGWGTELRCQELSSIAGNAMNIRSVCAAWCCLAKVLAAWHFDHLLDHLLD